MDPRKAATVSSPDLLKAFREGTGGAGEVPDTPLLIWLSLANGSTGDVEVLEYEMRHLENALDELRVHLKKGDGHAGFIVVGIVKPESVSQLEQ